MVLVGIFRFLYIKSSHWIKTPVLMEFTWPNRRSPHGQQQILDLVRRSIERTGAPPTRAEIAEILGFRSANSPRSICRLGSQKASLNWSVALRAEFD
jgi:hypothetical protein